MLIAVLVVVVVLLTRQDSEDAAAPTPTPTATATTTAPAEPTPSPTATSAPSPGTRPTASPAPTQTATPTGLPGASLGPVTGGSTPGTDGTWIADVRTAGQQGYDRVVFEFTDVVPTYEVAYADPPFVATNDEEVEVEGEAFLRVRMEGTSSFNLNEGVPVYEGPDRVTGDTQVVTEVVDVDDFEALVIWVVGLTEQRPFVVTELTDPARLVIDIES